MTSNARTPPHGIGLWLLAVRPRTLTLALAPVVAALGWVWQQNHGFRALPLVASLVGAVLIQAGTNLWNDVGDAVHGGDRPTRPGPPRVTAQGWASPARVRAAAMACFGGAALVGLYLAAVGGWPILALGCASLVAGWAYSFGPWPISYSPWGEAFVLAFFGLGAVGGTVWLQQAPLEGAVWVLGTAIGLPAAGVLMANNYRDAEADRQIGRRTLAIRLGDVGARWAFAAMIATPFLLLLSPVAPPGAWAGMAALPQAVLLVRRFAITPRGGAFNGVLAATARLQLILAVLVAVGAVL